MPLANSSTNQTNILQWNCRNIKTNSHYLVQYLHESPYDYDILCLQSLAVKKEDLTILKGYYYPPFYSLQDGKVRSAIYVKDSLQASPIRVPVRELSTACEVTTHDGSSLSLVNIYYPESCNHADLGWLQNLETAHWVVLGDFNAHHSWWGGEGAITDSAGRQLAEKIVASDLCLLNDGSNTRIPDRADHEPTAIDLTLVSSSLYGEAEWETCSELLGSDHLPISLRLRDTHLQEDNGTQVKYDYSNADWDGFQQRLVTAVYPSPAEDIDAWYEELRAVILQAAEGTIPQKVSSNGHRFPPNPWWNNNCKHYQKEQRKAYSRYKKCQSEETYNNLKQKRINFKKTVAEAKLEYWQGYIENNITDYKDSSKLWKKVMKIKNRYNPPNRPLECDGIKTTTVKEKADMLARTFANASHTESLPRDLRMLRTDLEKTFPDPPPSNNSDPLNVEFSFEELEKSINSLVHPRKAPGADPISYIMIKHFPTITRQELLVFYRSCWSQGKIPRAWKEARVQALLKQGKPPKSPSSYRPVSLTPHLGKLYERIIKERLEFFLEKNNIIPVFQAGFRKNRGCTDHIVKLTSHAKKALVQKRAVFTTFYDIKRAYDSVWHALLLKKMVQLNITGNMYNFFRTFLQGRSFRVKVGSELSEQKFVDMGLPQGSVVATVAFNIMLYDVKEVKLKDSEITLYADDIACWYSPNFRRLKRDFVKKQIMKTVQNNVDKIADYLKTNGFQLAAEKTVFIIFTNNRYNTEDYFIEVGGHKIQPSPTAKYLGVVFDSRLTWKAHVAHLLSKTNSLWNLVKIIKRDACGLNHPKIIVQIVKALVRSRLSYGQEAFFSAAPTLLSKLESRETSFLKLSLSIPRHADPTLLYREVGLLSLGAERELRTAQYVMRAYSAAQNSVLSELQLDFNNASNEQYRKRQANTPTIARRGLSISDYIKNLCETAAISTNAIAKQSLPPSPQWTQSSVNITTSLASYSKTEQPLMLASIAKEKISTELKDHLKIYTDGSKLDNEQVGSAFVIPSRSITEKFRLNNSVSVFSAEVFAIYKALSFLEQCPLLDKKIAILSDSKSALQALKNPTKNRMSILSKCLETIYNLKQRDCHICFFWIPSHLSIKGNDLADNAAKEGASLPLVTDNIGLSVSEVYSKLKHEAIVKWTNRFTTLAHQKNWVDPSVAISGVYPNLPRKFLPVFFSLRTQVLKTDYVPQNCICSSPLRHDHIYTCHMLKDHFKHTLEMLNKRNMSLSPSVMSCEGDNKSIMKTFVKEVVNSPIGLLV